MYTISTDSQSGLSPYNHYGHSGSDYTITPSPTVLLGDEEVTASQRTTQTKNRLRSKRKIDNDALPNLKGAMTQKHEQQQERFVNHLPQQLATDSSNSRKAQSQRDKKVNVSKNKQGVHHHDGVDKQLKGKEGAQASGATTTGRTTTLYQLQLFNCFWR